METYNRICFKLLDELRENHSGMETLTKVFNVKPGFVLRENHSGMETTPSFVRPRDTTTLRENHSGMLGTWRVEHGELRERTRVRFAHEKTRIFGAHKCHPVVLLYGISLLRSS